jgi:uncharacterized tellurite resistance protein B-like protein
MQTLHATLSPSALDLDESAARVLALMMVADGHLDESLAERLDQLDAWRRIGVSRSRFMRIARSCHTALGDHLSTGSWMPMDDMHRIDRMLDNVSDPELRLMVCRLAASVITADGRVSDGERMLYDHTLSHWHISHAQVTRAIMADRLH